MHSRPIPSIVHEVRRLAAEGTREFNLIAQDLSCYGRDLKNGTNLAALLRELVKIEGVKWIRLFYLYPTYFDDELLDVILKEDKICKYVDIPLQHISDSVLQRMHRRDSSASIRTLLHKLRAASPRMTIRTTLMVGFPGETEEDFKELCDFIREVRFDDMGAFKFSPQDGTPAARMTDQIEEDVKETGTMNSWLFRRGFLKKIMKTSSAWKQKPWWKNWWTMEKDTCRQKAAPPFRRRK